MKNCIILVLALLVSQGVMAQENLSVGPIAGVTFTKFRGDISNEDWKPGLTAGAFINYSSKTNWGFSGQVLYTQMGTKWLEKTQEMNLNYLQIPLLGTYFFGRSGQRLRPKLFAGPSLNFLLNARDASGNNINGDSNNRVYYPFDLGLTFGGGVNYRLTQKIWLNADVRYGLGLLDVVKTDLAVIKNNQWGINVGVSFPLGTYDKKSGRLR